MRISWSAHSEVVAWPQQRSARTSSLSPARGGGALTSVWCVTSPQVWAVTIRIPLPNFRSSMVPSYLYPYHFYGGSRISCSKSPDGTDDTASCRSCSHDGKSGLWWSGSVFRKVGSDRGSSRSCWFDHWFEFRKTSSQLGSEIKRPSSSLSRLHGCNYVRVLSTVEKKSSRPWNSKGLEEDALYS